MPQFNAPSTFMSNPVNDIQNPGSASKPISIQTDVVQRRDADIMSSDIPDLTYDYDYELATPHSASSSHMVPTPVFDWNVPLGGDGKDCSSPPPESWPSSSEYFSSPESYRHQCALDGLDELNWEKQRYDPAEMSPLFPNDPRSFYPPEPQSSTSQYSPQDAPASQHTYTSTSTSINDTPSASLVDYSPHTAQPSSSTSACTTISPSALNPPSISPRIRMRPQPYPQPPLKLHQPRPSRRIPIISLAELASAGEEMSKQPRSRRISQSKHAGGTLYSQCSGPYPRSPVEALSPLPLECHGFSPVSEKREILHLPKSTINVYQHPQTSQLAPNPTLPSRFTQRGLPSKVISCSCGCMESYTIQ